MAALAQRLSAKQLGDLDLALQDEIVVAALREEWAEVRRFTQTLRAVKRRREQLADCDEQRLRRRQAIAATRGGETRARSTVDNRPRGRGAQPRVPGVAPLPPRGAEPGYSERSSAR
jgi:hypothetical protein